MTYPSQRISVLVWHGAERRLLSFLCILVLIAMGCSDPKLKQTTAQSSEEDSSPVLSFSVDRALLGPSVSDEELGISLSAPKGWDLAESSLLEQLRAQLVDQLSQGLEMELQWLFFNEQSHAMCVVSRLQPAEPGREILPELEQAYRSSFPDATVNTAKFVKEPFHVQQILVNSPNLVVIKLLFNAVPAFEVDYVVPKSTYSQELHAIESSIGSIVTVTGNLEGEP